jgi:hypothetical protein
MGTIYRPQCHRCLTVSIQATAHMKASFGSAQAVWYKQHKQSQGMQLVIESDMRRLKSGATLDESWRRRIAESLSLDPKRNKKFGLLLEIDFSQKYLVSGKKNPENKFNLVCGSFLCAYYVLIILLF